MYDDKSLVNELQKADQVWLASSWKDWQVDLVGPSIKNIRSLTKAEIKVFGRKDFPYFKPGKYIGIAENERARLREPLPDSRVALNKKLSSIVGDGEFVNVQRMLCEVASPYCRVFDSDGMLKTYDGGHLTRYGAVVYGAALKKMFHQ